MYNYLQAIALHGMKGKKRNMIYMFLVLFLSMTFLVVNVSISGSLQKTQEQLRYDTYGDWDIALFHSRDLSNAPGRPNRPAAGRQSPLPAQR